MFFFHDYIYGISLTALKDKQSLLQAWVEAGENVNAVETTLKIQRSQEGELAREKELLTIDEMRARGMSQPLCLKLNNQMLSPDQTMPSWSYCLNGTAS